ncbi:MAG: FIST C-terminal domain-containing protein [Deltaproteobacteria bacterium]|nr:FIST C-terminal domain-containing protein [Deltaproteobacteria bacterium]
MKSEQRLWTENQGWQPGQTRLGSSAHLVFVFGARTILSKRSLFQNIKKIYPNAHVLGCSASGEIHGSRVYDNTLTSTAAFFEDSFVKTISMEINNRQESAKIGEQISQAIDKNNLRHIFVISDGINVNGSELVKGLNKHIPENVAITGGLAGDGESFEKTFVLCDAPARKNLIVVIGFYGQSLNICYGSKGGWDPFGPERVITHSDKNILYELDGKSALDLYKRYLGEHAKGLPATALLFPLSIRLPDGKTNLVRTILSINPNDQGMVFAGDVPEGSYARFMKANMNRLIDGAGDAARKSNERVNCERPDLAILISCVGRKMVLKQRVEEEIESVRDMLGENTIVTGFYSYGEIAPAKYGSPSELHNQTMTITTISER